MGNGPQERRTDSTPLEVLRKRAEAARQRGDKYVKSSGVMLIKFRNDFGEFAADVAHNLRREIVYRTDHGRFARALVRASGDLEVIHKAYVGQSTAEDAPIRLAAHFFRRRDPIAPNRWVMSIRFSAPDWGVFDADVVSADAERMRKAREALMDKVIDCAEMLADGIPGPQGERIRAMIDIAERLPFPTNEQLWYYNPHAMREYFSWHAQTDDKKRLEMTGATGGRLPFDGTYYGTNGSVVWRIYPLKTILRRYGGSITSFCNPDIKKELTFMDNQIFESFSDMNVELNQTTLGGGASYSALQKRFLSHLVDLQNDKRHFYSVYK
jgi:hypothetical protein